MKLNQLTNMTAVFNPVLLLSNLAFCQNHFANGIPVVSRYLSQVAKSRVNFDLNFADTDALPLCPAINFQHFNQNVNSKFLIWRVFAMAVFCRRGRMVI